MVLLFLGPKGSGKDTQASILADTMGFQSISTGALFRKEIAAETELGKQSKALYDEGKLVTDELVFAILEKNLSELDSDDIILNGVIRNSNQVEPVETILSKLGKDIDMAIAFNLSDEEAIKRLANRWTCPKCNRVYHTIYDPPKQEGICDIDGEQLIQREDDKPDAVRSRLNEDRVKTGPVIEHYREKGMLHEIDASQSIDDIAEQLKTLITRD